VVRAFGTAGFESFDHPRRPFATVPAQVLRANGAATGHVAVFDEWTAAEGIGAAAVWVRVGYRVGRLRGNGAHVCSFLSYGHSFGTTPVER